MTFETDCLYVSTVDTFQRSVSTQCNIDIQGITLFEAPVANEIVAITANCWNGRDMFIAI